MKIGVGVVGATGVVGETFLGLLEEREFPLGELRLFASEKSVGTTRNSFALEHPVRNLTESCFDGLDLVFFSSGDEVSKEWAPKAVAAGAFAIDNSAAFRMRDDVRLIVPEVNGDLLPTRAQPALIANPNCSTIQLAMALHPLVKTYGLRHVRVASYQSVSGAGRGGLEELLDATKAALEGDDRDSSINFTAPIAFNCIPQIGAFDADGYSSEELKIMRETKKILRLPGLNLSAFTVRVPTMNAHAEAVWVTLEKSPDKAVEILKLLANSPGLVVHGPDQSPGFATQRYASGRDSVFVSRVHRDGSEANTWLMWVVADNLRKGAALNGLQIAERIFDINR